MPKTVLSKNDGKPISIKDQIKMGLYLHAPKWQFDVSRIDLKENSFEDIENLAKEVYMYHFEKKPLSKDDNDLKKKYFEVVKKNLYLLN